MQVFCTCVLKVDEIRIMGVWYVTLNNISIVSWLSLAMVDISGLSGENQLLVLGVVVSRVHSYGPVVEITIFRAM